jgi:hypothetical protein
MDEDEADGCGHAGPTRVGLDEAIREVSDVDVRCAKAARREGESAVPAPVEEGSIEGP